jgi:hypothetical protein
MEYIMLWGCVIGLLYLLFDECPRDSNRVDN